MTQRACKIDRHGIANLFDIQSLGPAQDRPGRTAGLVVHRLVTTRATVMRTGGRGPEQINATIGKKPARINVVEVFAIMRSIRMIGLMRTNRNIPVIDAREVEDVTKLPTGLAQTRTCSARAAEEVYGSDGSIF